VIYKGRTVGMNKFKEAYAIETAARTLAEAMEGADVFVGLSVANCVTREMVRSMARDPILFAMANPDPEITYEEVQAARNDAIFGTGRSDYPNQVNNVLGFPFIFRGALDVRARKINMEMKLAATKALAALAKEDVPDSVIRAYGLSELHFSREYILPKPLDPRVMMWIAPAVAKAAIESGVARRSLDLDAYLERLAARQGQGAQTMYLLETQARKAPKRVVYGEGREPRVLRAAHEAQLHGIAHPILLGHVEEIHRQLEEIGLHWEPEIIDPVSAPKQAEYAEHFYAKRQRRGVTLSRARELMRQKMYFGPMMVECGDADAFLAGLAYNYPDVLRPALQCVGAQQGRWVSGVYMMLAQDRKIFFTDATVLIDPTAEQLAAIALNAADLAERFGLTPRIAMLSFSNFGSTPHPQQEKVQRATELVRQQRPDLEIDGEMQADVAVSPELMQRHYPFSRVQNANVLVFPDLSAANAAYKLLRELGGAEAIGPILVGMQKPIQVLATGAEVRDIFNMTTLAVIEAQENG
jgi:malate dehydrogenase (oxaloacetate-decarboxylating)(NADP+)